MNFTIFRTSILLIMLITNFAFGQIKLKRTVIGPTGGFRINSNSSIVLLNATGQTLIHEVGDESTVLLQGFIHPLNVIGSINDQVIFLYPNPTFGVTHVLAFSH